MKTDRSLAFDSGDMHFCDMESFHTSLSTGFVLHAIGFYIIRENHISQLVCKLAINFRNNWIYSKK